MKQYVVFLLLIQLIVSNVSETSAECTSDDGGSVYMCNGGSISDLARISSEAQAIYIEDMVVGKLPSNLLARFPYLQLFQCTNCGLREIGYASFRSLPDLQQLMLDNNLLTRVRGDWFIGLDNLVVLDLSSNRISNIENGDFGNATTLNELRLSGNPMDCVDPKAFANMKELSTFELADIPNFKCPRAVLQFVKYRGIEFKPDEKWDLMQNEKTVGPFEVTESPKATAPTKPAIIETRAPPMVSEEVYIPTLTTMILKTSDRAPVVETTTPMNVVQVPSEPVVQTKEPSNIVNGTDSETTTQETTSTTILVTASQVAVKYVPPETTKAPIIGDPVKPTSGEQTIVPPVMGIPTTESNVGDGTETPAESGSTESLHNGGYRPDHFVDEYFITMFVVAFYRSLL